MSLLFRAQRPGLPHLPSLRLLRASPRPLPRAGDFRAWDSDASWALGPGLDRLPRHTRFQSVTPSWPRTESRRKRVASPSSMSGQSPARKRALGPRRSHASRRFSGPLRLLAGPAGPRRAQRAGPVRAQTSRRLQAGRSRVPRHLPREAQAPMPVAVSRFRPPGGSPPSARPASCSRPQ